MISFKNDVELMSFSNNKGFHHKF